MICSYCGAALHGFAVDAIELDRCESCQAVWFDREELKEAWTALSARQPASFNQLPRLEGVTLPCPRCRGVRLQPVEFSREQFHRCGRCYGVLAESDVLFRLKVQLESILQDEEERTGNVFEELTFDLAVRETFWGLLKILGAL